MKKVKEMYLVTPEEQTDIKVDSNATGLYLILEDETVVQYQSTDVIIPFEEAPLDVSNIIKALIATNK